LLDQDLNTLKANHPSSNDITHDYLG
jgi:hypothetical protein